ncbi:MAG: helix-hairpin-helix domain-containing protein [Bacteroidota bacterium]
MRFPRSVVEYFGFTKTETRVILFILGAFLVGGGLKLYEFYFQAADQGEPLFDYTESDREFQKRAEGLLKSAPSERSGARAVTEGSSSQPAKRSKRKATPTVHSININTASKDQLMALPGIGEELSERIILYREDHGQFASVGDLKNVKGIGDKKFEQLKLYITLE